MREGITLISKTIYEILGQNGLPDKKSFTIQVLNDFKNSTTKEMDTNFSQNHLDEMDDLSNHFKIYSELIDLINCNSKNYLELENAYFKIIRVYEFYERKYISELEYRNKSQRENYIHTILSPLITISLYFQDLQNKSK